MVAKKRYQARLYSFDPTAKKEWCVWDNLRNGPFASGFENRAEAVNCARAFPGNIMPKDGLAKVNMNNRLDHYRKVLKNKITRATDKYDLVKILCDQLEYASDRMHDSHVFIIQGLWEEVQKQNGYFPYRLPKQLAPKK